MSIPETTSVEAFWRYAGGQCLFESRGEARRDIKAWIIALPPVVDTMQCLLVSETFLAWATSGGVDVQGREAGQPWITTRVRKGFIFLTTGGAPAEGRAGPDRGGGVSTGGGQGPRWSKATRLAAAL